MPDTLTMTPLRRAGLRLLSLALLLSLTLWLSGCGGGATAAPTDLTDPVAVALAATNDRIDLGQQIFTDANLSEPRGTPCAACTAVGIPNCLNAQFDPSAPLPVLTIPAVPTGASGGGAWAIPASRKGTKVVARNITVLDFEPPNAAPVGVMGLAVTLYAQDATASDKVTQVRYQITAWLQN